MVLVDRVKVKKKGGSQMRKGRNSARKGQSNNGEREEERVWENNRVKKAAKSRLRKEEDRK